MAISRELANLLGGEIQLRSTPGVGSVFTLYLPLTYLGSAASQDASAPSETVQPAAASTAAARAAERPLEQVLDDRDDSDGRATAWC